MVGKDSKISVFALIHDMFLGCPKVTRRIPKWENETSGIS